MTFLPGYRGVLQFEPLLVKEIKIVQVRCVMRCSATLVLETSVFYDSAMLSLNSARCTAEKSLMENQL
jgi:hypothetical protein